MLPHDREYFKDRGKGSCALDGLADTFADGAEEIGWHRGADGREGYNPSIYTIAAQALERSGNFEDGSITGLYTVLAEGDDVNEPIADTVRSIIDGHVVLSRTIAMRNHYPAIDVLSSISRLMTELVDEEHRTLAGKVRRMLSVYHDNRDLISIGAYKEGSNPELDKALRCINRIQAFLQQGVDQKFSYEETRELMRCLSTEPKEEIMKKFQFSMQNA